MENPSPLQKLEDSALSSALLFATFMLEKGSKDGLSALSEMNLSDVTAVVQDIMREGQADAGVIQHALESLLLLLRDSETRSSHDALTKIKNRSHIVEAVDLHLERMRRNEAHHGALIFIDLDGFKPINDVFGHAAGDAALIKAASTLSESVRQIDVVARVGGDEFAILLPDAKEQQAKYLSQRLSEIFSTLSVNFEGKDLPIRASIGMTTMRPGQTSEDVFAAADTEMYAVKNSKSSTRAAQYVGAHPAPALKVI